MTSRRYAVPFDPDYFARRARAGDPLDAVASFRHAFATNHWAGDASRSGPGASLQQTAAVRRALPTLLRRLNVRTLLDLPCGDGSWMSTVDLGPVTYLGGDLLPEVIAEAAERWAGPRRHFAVMDLLDSPLPTADIVLCRDCLVHFSFADINRAVRNLQAAGPAYLLTTTFPAQDMNVDIRTGDWRPINLCAAPFDWPPPEFVINEECTEADGRFADKSLGLWRTAALATIDPVPGLGSD